MDERILGLLKEARRQLELERQKRSEPIAIVGIGCRLPGGVSTPEEFWNLLQRGVDTTGGVPANRWDAEELYDADPDAPGKAYVKRGAFLDDIEGFDSEFFGISPREALGMDPQQRLLLECSWEALEDAGIPPESLRGSATGVWVGLCAEDYARRILHSDDRTAIDAYSTLGNTRSIAAGRISYVLDLRGPSVQLDTACSSSLVAIHQAVQSLRSGESNLALVGGVNVMSAPESTIALCKLRALAPDGRCKTFDASADGYGRGEGCGIVVLKRLADARAAGDRIYAVVRGSAVNHDGRSNGLTAPNGLAQEAIVRAALASAALEPTDIDYVEAHGTGTPLGDPIEVIALSRVYGENRDPSKPLYLGAVKSNLGHLEGAAGIAGLIKVALCLSHEQIAPHLHFKEPNAKIPWHRLPVRVASEAVDWPRTARPRVAAVSSFGLSGTNAHTLLEEAPPAEEIGSTTTRAAELIVLSARTSEALAFAAQRLHDHIAQTPGQSLTALAHSLATTRSALEHRLGLAITSRDALLEALALAARGEGTGGARGVSRDQRGKLAWLFTGQGAQQVGMGRQLYDAWPVFRDALERAFRALDPHLERPLRSVMWADPGSSDATLLDQTGYTQPALFALEWALAELWSSWGVEAHVLAGHSVGEITAAAVAGVFSLEDAARLVCARGRFMQALPRGGAMVSIAAPEADVLLAIAAYERTISIAALNAPTSTVIAGVEVDVLAVAERFAARGVQTKRLTVSHAFHSPLMDPMLEDFAHVARSISFAMPKLALVSNVSGALAGSEITTPEYWVRHVREAVRFSQGVVALHAAGARVFLELGPRATLIGLVPASLAGSEASLITSLRTGRSEPVAVLEGLAAWFSQGGSVDWAQVFPSGSGRVTLPHYPWQRQRYWTDGSVTRHLVGTATAHPLLGARIASAGADAVYESLLSIKDPRWLSDHRVGGHVVVPAAAFADLLLAAAEDQLEGSEAAVQGLLLQAPLIVPETGALRLQVLVSARGSKASVYSQPAQASPAIPWTLHATAELSPSGSDDGHARVDLASLRERCTDSVDVSELYASFRTIGLDYGESFRSLRTLRRGKGEAVAELELDDAAKADGYALHPTLLDGALQAVAGLLDVSGSQPLLPFELARFVVHRHGAKSAVARVVLSEVSEDGAVAEITLVDAVGRTVAELQRLGLRRANLALIGREATAAPPAFFALDWREVPAPARAAVSGRWLIVAEPDDDTARALVLALRGSGAECDQIALSELARAHHAEHVVCVWGVESEPDGALRAAQRGLQTIQAVLTIKPAPRLYWITRAATAVVEGDLPAPAAAALWGLGRTVTAEHPELHLSLIDLDPRAVAAEVFLRELGANDDDNEVAWRRGKRHVARLVRAPRAISSTDNYQLATQDKGVLDSLALVPIQRDAPGPGEVQIEVAASGLNFRDVLNALGMYPGEAGPLGNECSGLVVEVGSAVEGFAVGDRVMALAPGAFRRFVTVDARLVSAIPAGFSFEQAAGVPLVFLTAWYALHDLAQLQPGERLLVHAAAGGVGMAAVQIAQQIGAELLATASPAKWDAVRAMGVEHVASSRELGFADVFRAARGGADVVLNALTGSFIDDSLSLLSPGGRFIEMGKAEIRDADAVAAEHPGVAYRAFDLSEAGPDRIAEMFRELNAGFASGLLRPLPLRTFALSEAETAFRFMAQAKHVGKVVLRAAASARQTDASVLITGGLGALGLEVARHLASHGYRHLVLTSRRGLDTYGAPEAVAALEALGARVTVAAVDATDREGLAALLATLPQEYPLRGVVHAAGLIDDGLLEEQTPARFERVISPKVIGAWNLHELTRELDFFVLFSSMAGTLGSAAQGAYAAANAALDALAARRRAHSLPATSLAWGPWAERGMAASLDARLQVRFARQGISLLTPAQGVALFDAALSRSEAHLLVVPLDLRRAAKVFDGDVPPLWRALVRMTAASTPVEQASWAREIAALPEQARLGAVSEMIRGELARVLSLASPDLVPLERPLQELGLDSLMAVELRNALSRRTGVALSATLAFDYPTPQAIGKFILGQLSADEMPALPALPAFAVGEDEPIAIVGIGCRFPGGVTDPDSFWQLLEQGVDAVTEIPKDRWDIDEWYDPDPDAPGKMITRWGAFLDHIDEFDPAFFGISPREAASVDPQERLLLETTWEALEHAGIRPDSLMDSNTGVYMGLCGNEYQGRVVADVQAMDAYGMLGTMHSTMVGRLSYWLGLKGPNLPVDTACSSSLVAIHLAAQALRTGECHLALAGGANVLLGPEGMVYFSRVRAMSPTGRCHTFSADADGYVRAEGAGVVVLERLSDARRKGHRILSILRATAVNQDGRSNGLTAPNGPSQQAVIREALQRGGIAPADVGYVECHGTGTPLGDPIEVQALAAVLGDGRDPGRPVLLSSLKSNLGHMEGAAGVGGLIKAVLALQHGRIPKSLHFNEPNPHIDWKSLPVQVAAEALDWPRNGKPRIAGVSSFGISGTNAHALLEEPPAAQPLFVAPARSAELVVLSAKSSQALKATAARLRAHLSAHPELTLGDVAQTLATTRSLLEHRLALAVPSREELLDALAVAELEASPVVPASPGKVAFVFPGQGSQWLGMGRQLLAEEPVFNAALVECDRVILAEAGWSVLSELTASPEDSRLARVDVVQPVLFSLQVALAALWRSWGVEPDAVVGHSMGEVAAACVAGSLSLQDGAAIMCRRSRLLRQISGQGEMALLELSFEQAQAAIAGFEDRLAVAVSNGPTSTVISGEPAAITTVLAQLDRRGVFCRRVKVDVASHSPQVDPLLAELVSALGDLRPQTAQLPMHSTVTGAMLSGAELAASYWADNLRQPVQFARSVQALLADGFRMFVEISPHPLLVTAVDRLREDAGVPGACTGSLRRDQPERLTLLASLGDLIVQGHPLRANRLFTQQGRRVDLPAYAWQRQQHWIHSPTPARIASRDLDATLRQLVSQGKLSDLAVSALPEIVAALAAARAGPSASRSRHYSVEWRSVVKPAGASLTPGEWLIVGKTEDAQTLAKALAECGKSARWNDHARALHELSNTASLEGVVFLASDDEDAAHRVLAIEAAISSRALTTGAPPTRAWWLTRGAVGTSATDAPTRPEQALVWGLGRTFALEHPRTWGGLIDLPPEPISAPLATLVATLLSAAQSEDQLAVRGSEVFVPRLVSASPVRSHPPSRFELGTVLVTGGLGALGGHVARWLARRGARNLLLMSRQGLASEGAQATLAELEALGARVTVAAAHVTDRAAVASVLEQIPSEHPLTAVFHVAGVSDLTPLEDLTPEHFDQVIAAKYQGTLVLDELTRHIELESFVCFSSIASVWGAGRQAAYAAANSFLDAWAHAARARGRRAVSISWGAWGGGGMVDESARAQLARRGLHTMTPEDALSELELVLSTRQHHAVVVDVDWTPFRQSLEAWGPRPLLDELRVPDVKPTAAPEPVAESVPESLQRLEPSEHEAFLVRWLSRHVARVLRIANPETIRVDAPLSTLGMDSLMAVEMRTRLGRELGFPLSGNFGLDAALSTITALARRLLILIEDSKGATRALELDLHAEATLDTRISPLRESLPDARPTTALLTGATGFLGAFLLSELLAQTSARVVCLVRAQDPADGKQRLAKNLKSYGLSTRQLEDRVEVLIGDLSKPYLGLGEATFKAVAEQVDAIYNNGAHVSFVAGYHELKPSHIDATRDLLLMASMGRPKALHHISSVAVFDAPAYRNAAISEEIAPEVAGGIRLPYSQCKWVSEAMVREAGARGLPVTIHRPSLIAGASNGEWNTTDFMCRVLQGGFIELGCFPSDIELLLDASPVDFVARAIVHLSGQRASLGHTFHLQHPQAILLHDAMNMLRSFGYRLEGVPFATWLARVARDPSSAIRPLLFYFTHRWAPENLTALELWRVGLRPQFMSETTTKLLAAADIRCPPLDRELLGRYLARLVDAGFVSPPRLALSG